nr:unnamed protein product [Callosobruchus chinensis]
MVPCEEVADVSVVTKGLLQKFGCQNKNGINRLEVTLNGVPLSIQDCYDIVTETLGFNIYRAYRKLVQHGYRLIRYEEILRKRTMIRKQKPKVGKEKQPMIRLLKDVVRKVLLRQQSIAIRRSNKLHLVSQVYISQKPQIFIMVEGNLLEQVQPDGPDIIYAVCTDDVSFYQAAKVEIPFCDYI